MWIRQQRAETKLCKPNRAFGRALAMAALMTGLVLGTATFALAAHDPDNNPPGPRGGAGTNWENPPGPRGGPGASPDAKPWRPWIIRKLFDNDNNPPGPRGGRGTNWENPPGPRGGPGASPDAKPWRPWVRRRIHNAQQPKHPLRPATQRRIYNARHPQRPPGFRHNPRRRLGGIRRR